MSADVRPKEVLKTHEQIAVQFAEALLWKRSEEAFAMLGEELAACFTPKSLQDRFKGMWTGYGEGEAETVEFDEAYSLENWPSKLPGDLGWAYVSVFGMGFVEAISVVVHDYQGSALIRKIEWGRP